MYRGVIELTKEELDSLIKAFHWELNGSSVIASKLQYAIDGESDVKTISVSEEDLELILDDIMPVDPNNIVLQRVSEKIGEKLRKIRELKVKTTTEYI